MPQLQNQCEDRCLAITNIRAKWSPKDRPGEGGKSDTVELTDEQIKTPEVQDFLARGLLKRMPDNFEPSTIAKPPKPGANSPRSPKPKQKMK